MKRALALLLGLATSVILVEVGLRVVARFHAPVRYLVTVGNAVEQPVFESLEAYLASRADLVPHRDFLNYRNNAFGLNDIEFVVPKPSGRFRIMVLGDSFTYGLVPYPDAVMTRLEEALRARCTGVDLDLLNFGIGGANVWDYKTLFELAGQTFDPDLVLVNFYLGNDAPDLSARPPSFRRIPEWLRTFYLARYVVNLVRLETGLERHVATDTSTSREPSAPNARGGSMVNAAAPALPGRRSADRTHATLRHGSSRSCGTSPSASRARPGHPPYERAWRPTLSILDLLRHQVTGQGRRLMIALYPSVLQVYPDMREQLERELRQRTKARRGPSGRGRSVATEPCRARVLSHRGARLLRHDAGSRRGEPTIAAAAVQGARHALDSPRQSCRCGDTGPLAPAKPCVPRFRSHLGLTAFEAHLRARPPDHRSARGHWPPSRIGRVNS